MDYNHLIEKVRHAANGGIGVLSSGEAVAAALVLNRHDWLTSMGYTIAEALERVGGEISISQLRMAERQMRQEMEAAAEDAEVRRQAEAMDKISSGLAGSDDVGVDLQARFVTHSEAPGYRDATLTFDVKPLVDSGVEATRLNIRLQAADTEDILRILGQIHRTAWSGSRPPLDAAPNETMPRWLSRPPLSA